ncbi:haloacid dehalogenase-like hydrolase-domain-containing protein [Xylariaceae sp. FL1272]|nr:haloacid dehalogenase-like hydrolase-domain-containing protein [Xylariaceae sp. FL1272]
MYRTNRVRPLTSSVGCAVTTQPALLTVHFSRVGIRELVVRRTVRTHVLERRRYQKHALDREAERSTMSIFLDFDGTITTEDTVRHIADFALRVQAERNANTAISSSDPPSNHDSADSRPEAVTTSPPIDAKDTQDTEDLPTRWKGVVKAYLSEYSSHCTTYHTQPHQRTTTDSEIMFQRSQKDVELRSLERLNGCRIFHNISPYEFKAGGRDLLERGVVTVRKGFKTWVQERQSEGWKVGVVSVNWSKDFIEGVLEGSGVKARSAGDGEGVVVYANEVDEHGRVVGPDILNNGAHAARDQDREDGQTEKWRNLTNSEDKLDVFRRAAALNGGGTTVYFGDSTTDMECLLEADWGVVMADGEDSKLIETFRRIGEEVPRARNHGNANEEGNGGRNVNVGGSGTENNGLVWAESFEEVGEFVRFDVRR